MIFFFRANSSTIVYQKKTENLVNTIVFTKSFLAFLKTNFEVFFNVSTYSIPQVSKLF